MSPEFYTIIAVGVALAGLILNGLRSLSASIADTRKELREEFHAGLSGLRSDLREELGGLRSEVRDELGGFRSEVRDELGGLRSEVRDELGELRSEVREDIGGVRLELADLRREFNAFGAQMHKEIAALSERVARLEGLVEGLRDAVTGKAA